MIQLLNDRFENVLPNIKFDAIITDPPYPDYLAEEYGYYDGILDWCSDFICTQLIFWSARVDFPLSYNAVHIWDKLRGVGTMYERIFERNTPNISCKVYRGQKYNNDIDAVINRDVLTGHPSQKPIKLIRRLLLEYTKEGDTIFDPFTGSGTTAIACLMDKRNFIGCEANKEYFLKAQKRIADYQLQGVLF